MEWNKDTVHTLDQTPHLKTIEENQKVHHLGGRPVQLEADPYFQDALTKIILLCENVQVDFVRCGTSW